MSFRLSSPQICVGAAVLAVGGLLVCSAQAGGKERGRPIEFSVPRSDEVTTNLHQLTSKKDGLKQLEEDLYQPLQSFSPRSSLDGVAAPPPRAPAAPVIQSKRVKELLERRKNWVFMSPEDLASAPSAEDVLKAPQIGPDGQEKKELPAIERYYHRLSNKQAESDNPLQFKDKSEDLFGMPRKSDSRDERVPQEDLIIPSGVRESAQSLNKLVESDRSDGRFYRAAPHGDSSDIFGLGTQPLSKEQMQEHKKFMDDYRSIVDPSWHPPAVATPGNPLPIFVPDAASPAGKPAVGLPSSLSPTPRTALDVQMDVINPRLGPPGLPDVNAQALGQTRPTPPLPNAEPTRVAPVAPPFTAPRRSF
jgi:hypothetical protein